MYTDNKLRAYTYCIAKHVKVVASYVAKHLLLNVSTISLRMLFTCMSFQENTSYIASPI